ncbi:hypothetical protein [Natrinema soli]|nr:hypothetical protein [Natrinema soli]
MYQKLEVRFGGVCGLENGGIELGVERVEGRGSNKGVVGREMREE